MKFVLFHFPAACSRVTMNALEEIGLEFEDRCVNLRTGVQSSAEYLAVNPDARVPALAVGGRIMTENAAILFFLDRQYPHAQLLPHSGDPQGVRADGIAKLTNLGRRAAERIGGGWWYGERWSIVDTYLYWAFSTAAKGGWPLAEHPVLAEHALRVRARPAFQRALVRERAAVEREAITDVEL